MPSTPPTTQTYPDKSRAPLALILAAVSWVPCVLLLASIPALVLGSLELRGIRLGRRSPDKRGTALAATIVAAVNIVLSAVLLAVAVPVAVTGFRAARDLAEQAEKRIPLVASDGTARVVVPGLWRVPEERDPDYILEANAPLGVAAFNAVRVDKDEELTLESAAQVTLETLRAGQPSLKTLAERRTSYGTLPVVEIDASLEMDGQELRTYFAFIDGAHGLYQLTGTAAQALDDSLGKVIKGIFASFEELAPPRAPGVE